MKRKWNRFQSKKTRLQKILKTDPKLLNDPTLHFMLGFYWGFGIPSLLVSTIIGFVFGLWLVVLGGLIGMMLAYFGLFEYVDDE